jgi:hypothetical protein
MIESPHRLCCRANIGVGLGHGAVDVAFVLHGYELIRDQNSGFGCRENSRLFAIGLNQR